MPSKRGKGKRRQHVYRRPDRGARRFPGQHHCPECGKWSFETRDEALAAVRLIHPGATVHYYRCTSEIGTWWHYTSMTAEQLRTLRDEDFPEEKAC